MSEVQHGNRLGTKNIDVFWNTGVTDAMALSVVVRYRKIYRKILWGLLNKTWRPVHWRNGFYRPDVGSFRSCIGRIWCCSHDSWVAKPWLVQASSHSIQSHSSWINITANTCSPPNRQHRNRLPNLKITCSMVPL